MARRPIWLLAGLLLLAPLAQAGDGPGGRRHGPPPIGHVLEKHAERLALDDATLASIREIVDASHAESSALRDQLGEMRRQMHELLSADPPDETAVLAHADRLGAVRTELRKHRLRSMLRIRALLSPEQRAELVRIREERRARRHGEKPPL